MRNAATDAHEHNVAGRKVYAAGSISTDVVAGIYNIMLHVYAPPSLTAFCFRYREECINMIGGGVEG